ncbi:hypothetical protein, partial [Achromobacter xylosoxidans]|uniref:hypothetical protein n=1 Tax=Alcaligenes xylosoxydans xylosoxydans TaxID=85698 RepID=UPI001F21D0A7
MITMTTMISIRVKPCWRASPRDDWRTSRLRYFSEKRAIVDMKYDSNMRRAAHGAARAMPPSGAGEAGVA